MKSVLFFLAIPLMLSIGCGQENRFESLDSFEVHPITGTRIVRIKDSIVNNTVFSSDTILINYYDAVGRHIGLDEYGDGEIISKSKYSYTDSSCIIDINRDPDHLVDGQTVRVEYYNNEQGFKRILIVHPADTFSIADYTVNENYKFTRIKRKQSYNSIVRYVDEFKEYDKRGNLQRAGSYPSGEINTNNSNLLPPQEIYVNSYRRDTLVRQEMRQSELIQHITTFEYHGDTLIENLLTPYGKLRQKTYKSLSEKYFYKYAHSQRIFKVEYFRNGFFIGRENYILENLRHDP
jgi:hypothetical protein